MILLLSALGCWGAVAVVKVLFYSIRGEFELRLD